MTYYRLYLCDRQARINDVAEGFYESDICAIEAGEKLRRDGVVQIWQQNRHVLTVLSRA